jgi:hypothetical protein
LTIRDRGKGRYEVVVYLGRDPLTGKERRVSRMAKGRRAARDLERELNSSKQPVADATMGVLFDRWLDVARLEASTRYQAKGYINRVLRPRIGTTKVASVTPDALDALYLDLRARSGAWP